MLLKSLIFAFIVFGLTVLISFLVAVIIKCVAFVVQRGKDTSSPAKSG